MLVVSFQLNGNSCSRVMCLVEVQSSAAVYSGQSLAGGTLQVDAVSHQMPILFKHSLVS